jgi:hypothetical protein
LRAPPRPGEPIVQMAERPKNICNVAGHYKREAQTTWLLFRRDTYPTTHVGSR